MCDDRLDPLKIHVGGRLGRGQHGGGVENVQPLVFHRAHVEIIHRHDVEQRQIVFTAIHIFVPFHRRLKCGHPKGAFALVSGAHIKVQINRAPVHGGEMIGMGDQFTRNKCKKIRRFGPRVMPFGAVCVRGHRIAIGQQHGVRAVDRNGEGCHHIGAVGVIGDLAKSFGLALGAIHAIRHIKPLKGGVAFGVNFNLRLPDKGRVWHGAGQALIGQRRGHWRAVNRRTDQVEHLAVQKKRLVRSLGVWPKLNTAFDAGVMRGQIKGQGHRIHNKSKWGVISQINRFGGSITHRGTSIGNNNNDHTLCP